MREWWQQRATWQKVVMGVVGALVVIAVVAPDPDEAEADTTTTTAAPETTTSTSTTSTSTTTTQPTTTATETFDEDDFLVELIILESQCFNSAGALVTVEPDLTLTAATGPAPDQELTIVFEIHGGEFVETRRLDVTGDSYSYEEYVVSTESCEYDLSTEIVQVINR